MSCLSNFVSTVKNTSNLETRSLKSGYKDLRFNPQTFKVPICKLFWDLSLHIRCFWIIFESLVFNCSFVYCWLFAGVLTLLASPTSP